MTRAQALRRLEVLEAHAEARALASLPKPDLTVLTDDELEALERWIGRCPKGIELCAFVESCPAAERAWFYAIAAKLCAEKLEPAA